MMQSRSLSWSHGVFSVQSLGGMIGPTSFVLPDGRQVSPFHIAPWWNEAEAQKMGGLTSGLRGEWPCVPFGYPMNRDEFPQEWQQAMPNIEIEDYAHGYSSHVDWQFDDSSNVSDQNQICLDIEYPAESAIKRLRRRIKPDPTAAALDLSLQISVRRETSEPLALHGCFALPNVTGGAELVPGNFAIGRTHPAVVEPESKYFASNQTFTELTQVPGVDGGSIDASRLPFAAKVEELVQLDNIDGSFELLNHAEQYRLRFTWDSSILPSVLLWISNKGRSYAPWLNRHQCIGIEPICSPFGLSPETARAENPVSLGGTATSVALSPDKDLEINYRIEVLPL